MTDLVDCGECATQGCLAGKCRNAVKRDTTTQQEREAFKTVPTEPTQRMGNAGVSAGAKSTFAADMIYRAMVEASPKLATLSQRDEPVAEGKACQTCNGSGVVGRAPDDYFHCPDCTPPSPSLRDVCADARRIDALEAMVREGKLEIAKSLYGSGYEFGHWHKSGPTARVFNGSLRAAIDAALARLEGGK